MLDLTSLSRVVSHALRHEPWLYELELDDEGWTSVEGVLGALRSDRPEWNNLTETDLVRMIAASSKRRHEISGGRIQCALRPFHPQPATEDSRSAAKSGLSRDCTG